MAVPGKRFQPKCGWCLQEYDRISLSAHLQSVCPVAKTIHNAEVSAGRPLSLNEIKAVRDRARRELATEKEFKAEA